MNEKSVEIKNLRKVYDTGTVAVDDVSLTVNKGEFFGFLGPNGAGKTTTIHCITGVNRITSGSITVSGTDVVLEYRKARTKVGIAPQEFNIDIFGQVGKLLGYIGGYYGMAKEDRDKRVDELLEQFEMTEYKNTQFQHLSGGYKRRVMLARALMHDPDVLILDEPTAGVDVELRHDLWRYLQDLNKAGKTIILTSHYLEEVELLCSRIAIISKGKIVSEGSKDYFTRDGKTLEDHYLEIAKNNKVKK